MAGQSALALSIWVAMASLLGALQGTGPAFACIGIPTNVFPTCDVPAPRPDERVTVLYVAGGSALSSVTLRDDATVTEVVDLAILPAEKPHYLALSSGRPVIWRFRGAIDQVSRVVVFGSQYQGAELSGVIGVPKGRVEFIGADLEPLDSLRLNSCQRVFGACELSTYFEVPRPGSIELAGPGPDHRYRVDQFIEQTEAGTIPVPLQERLATASPRRQVPPGSGGRAARHAYKHGVAALDPERVIAPVDVKNYGTLPGPTGLNRLIEDGTILTAESPVFASVYERWNETISAPHRNRLDPDFLFSYEVDFLITKPLRLPATIRGSFLVADGVAAPDMNANDHNAACLFFADTRHLEVDETREQDPRCERALVAPLPARQRSWDRTIRSLASLRQRHPSIDRACRQTAVDKDSFFSGIALSEGEVRRAVRTDRSRRRVDVLVQRPGKVALFLDFEGGRTDWHLVPSPDTELVAVLAPSRRIGEGFDRVIGLPSHLSVTPLGRPWEARKECDDLYLPRDVDRGGPAAAHLDEYMLILAGRRFDSLLRKTDDGTWPKASSDPSAKRLVVIVD